MIVLFITALFLGLFTSPANTAGPESGAGKIVFNKLSMKFLILVLALAFGSSETAYPQSAKAPRYTIAKAGRPHVLSTRAPRKPIEYVYGWPKTPQSFCENQGVLALMIVKGDDILFECYRGKTTSVTPRFVASMTKTVVGMTMGLAVQDGKIKSLSDRAEDYVPGLKGTLHGAQTIKNLLQMSTGCCASDPGIAGGMIDQMSHEAWFGAGTIAFLRRLGTKEYEPGTKFIYSGPASATLTHVLQEALGSSLAKYFEERVWKPVGAEYNALWLHDTTGVPTGHVGFVATARDMTRFGLMVARGGMANGKRIVPEEWVKAATTISLDDAHLTPGRVTLNQLPIGYGYQTWILSSERRQFMMVGYGFQRVAGDPKTGAVITVLSDPAVTIAARRSAAYESEFQQLFKAVVSQAETGEL